MRGSFGVVVVIATGCNAILGVHELREVSDAATGDAAMSGPSPVTGTAFDTLYESPGKTTVRPRDLSEFLIQAYIPDGSAAGFRVITGVGTKEGTFSIPEVPEGTYSLVVTESFDRLPHFYDTASRIIDLGIDLHGRRDTPPATLPTPVTLDLSGMTLTADPGRIFGNSFSTAARLDEIVADPTLGTFEYTFDWRDTGASLLDKTRADDFTVAHTRVDFLPPGIQVETIADFYVTQDVTLVDGQPASIAGLFSQPAASQSFGFVLDVQAYAGGLEVASHQAIAAETRIHAGLSNSSTRGAPVLQVRMAASPQILRPSAPDLRYADPYPASWVRYLANDVNVAAAYTMRGSREVVHLVMNTFERVPLSDGFVRLAPATDAPHGIQVAGVDATQATAIPFDRVRPVRVQWLPVTGANHYIVTATHLIDDGVVSSIETVATFDTAATSVQMPAKLFTAGDAYVFGVSAVVDGSAHHDQGKVRRQGFPYARREALTARLLFSSACGNGNVDGVVEACDANGQATATCNADCTVARCGDGVTNVAAGESCDDVFRSVTCNADCTASRCGDGRVNETAGEVCDDGNATARDGCSPTCNVESGYRCTGSPSVCTTGP